MSLARSHPSSHQEPDIIVREEGIDSLRIERNSVSLAGPLRSNIYAFRCDSGKTLTNISEIVWDPAFETRDTAIALQHQGAITQIKCASQIVLRQYEYYTVDAAHFAPLTLHDIAEAIPAHESTVSRITNKLSITSPVGVVLLKSFFSTALKKSDGTVISSQVVQNRIGELINSEDPARPLSDSKIATILSLEGTQIARRTVAKYREGLGIAATSERKRH